MIELTVMPCPFCGETNLAICVTDDAWACVQCEACEAQGPSIRPQRKGLIDEADAKAMVDAWNERSEKR